MIITFKEFLSESKFRDIAINKSKDKEIDILINKNFIDDSPLIHNVYLEDYGVNLKFEYYDTPTHDIKTKIKDRTSLKSVSEFNDIFSKTMAYLIPDKLGPTNEIDKKGCYALYLKENNFFILVNIDPVSLMDGYLFINGKRTNTKYHSYVVTIHNNSSLEKYYKMIEIDDWNF